MKHHSLFVLVAMAFASPLYARQQLMKFAFRIKTKDGNIVGNVLIEAKDVEAAKAKLYRRYPGCQILNVQSRQICEVGKAKYGCTIVPRT